MQGGDLLGVPLLGNWSEMQPTVRRVDVLPVCVFDQGPYSSLS
jgi:hypothetical protein